MLFNSIEFLALLVATFGLYYVPVPLAWRKAWQVWTLLIASSVFYGWEDPRLLGLLGVSCLGNSVAVTRVIAAKLREDENGVRRWVRATVALNLLFLGLFKYAGFLAGILTFLPIETVEALKRIPLPIGISFYTFHGISMIIDVARCEVRAGTMDRWVPVKRPPAQVIRDTGLYLLFFPQLVAGPIVKAKEFWPQIDSKRFAAIPWSFAVRLLILGYFLKIYVADNLAEQTAALTTGAESISHFRAGQLIPLLYGYSLQIFADFAGYSLIAIGLGALFGYRLPDNFRFPYLSCNMTEFWRRWHLSLSSWLREYLYIPLGGNRKGEARTYVNLFLVMFLGGLWHGAEWKFALWGTLHGVLLALERFLTRGRAAAPAGAGRALFGWLLTFHATTLLWLTFLMPDMASIGAFFRGAANGGGWVGPASYSLVVFGGFVILYHAWGWVKEHRPSLTSRLAHPGLEGAWHALMLFLLVTNPGAPRGFIYFQF